MRRVFVILELVVFFSCASARGAGEFRALWADTFHPAMRNASEVSQLVSEARAGNFNAVIVEIRKRGDAYYNSNYEPKATDISPSTFDPLADLTAKAHDTTAGQRIEVHAWIVTYPIWNSQTTPPSNPAHPYSLHPDWLTKSDTGGTWNNANYVFDPGHPGVQQHTFNVAMDIVSRYDIDGLNFDYVRYAGNNWGYNDVAVNRFNQRFGRSGMPVVTDPQWLQFRRDQVSALVRKVYLSSIAVKPQIKISADTICFAPGVTTDAGWTNSSAAYTDVLQDWRSWMEEGIIDLNVPMMYFDQTIYASAWANWSVFAKNHRYNRHVALGPGIYLNTISNSIYQIRTSRIPTANGFSADGISGYSYAVTSADGLGRAAFLNAVTQPSLYDSNPTPVFAVNTNSPPMPWKTAPTRGHLKGFLLNANDSSGIDGGVVNVTGPVARTLVADATGFFGSVDLPPGTYSISATFYGFSTNTATLVVASGQVTNRNLSLVPLVVNLPPMVSVQPESQTLIPGSSATFSVTAAGTAPLHYQWRFNGGDILGAANPDYTVTNAQLIDAGNYSAVITNSFGSVTSSVATLSPIYNVSARPGYKSALVSWTTVLPGTSKVDFGPGINYGVQAWGTASETTNHVVLLTGLIPNSDYFFRVNSIIQGTEFKLGGFAVATAGEIIVDNPEAVFSGSWSVGTTATDKYLSDYRFAGTVSGSPIAFATFQPKIATPGKYSVYVWYPQGSNRATNASFSVITPSQSTNVIINQTTGGGMWQLIALNKDFRAGTNGNVRLANGPSEASRVVIADAVRWVYDPVQDSGANGSIPDWWSSFFFGTAPDPLADPDGDGYSNYAEYVIGTLPTDSSSKIQFGIERGPGILNGVFSPYHEDRIYELDRRSEISLSGWTLLTNRPARWGETQGAFALDPSPSSGQGFYRLKVRLAP